MTRVTTRIATSLLVVSALLVVEEARAETTISLATLAPRNSRWGKTLRKFRKKVKKKTDGEVNFKIYYNAVQGDEGAMVNKMRSGQLDGAVLTSVGLSRIYKPVMVLQLPGVVDTWAKLDKAQKAVKKDLRNGFRAKGYRVTSWGSVGRVHQMSKGFAVRVPDDVKGKRPLVWRGEAMGPMIYQLIGGVTPVPGSVVEVLPGLRNGKFNIVSAPPLAAELLQWSSHLTHINDTATVCALGGTIFRESTLKKLDKDTLKKLRKIQRKYERRGKKRIRKEDKKAYKRLAKRMTVVKLKSSERQQWEKILREATKRIAQGTYPPKLIKKVLSATGTK